MSTNNDFDAEKIIKRALRNYEKPSGTDHYNLQRRLDPHLRARSSVLHLPVKDGNSTKSRPPSAAYWHQVCPKYP